jgi:c(7)-type cytochrome triheme protein
MRGPGILAALAMLTAGLAGLAGAVPPGMSVEFDGKGEGKVTFTGASHTGEGMHCSNCHMELFYVSRSAQITQADHRRDAFCFTCHDGERAFASRRNCERCHVEPAADVAEPSAQSSQGEPP